MPRGVVLSVDGFRRALVRATAPCDKYACTLRAQCAVELLACQSFARFVVTGRAADPCATSISGRWRKREVRVAAAPVVSRELYDRAFEHET